MLIFRRSLSTASTFQNILVSRPRSSVALLTLNRPKQLNALSTPLFHELNQALVQANDDKDISAVVLTGSEKAFAGPSSSPVTGYIMTFTTFTAGADIKEMQSKTFADVYSNDFLASWTAMRAIRKPIIAACVLPYLSPQVSDPTSSFINATVSAVQLIVLPENQPLPSSGPLTFSRCDIILASPTAKFGLPEITLGVIPGGGGTQRLAGIVGKSRAMELVLTGRQFDADEAERWGVVSRVVRTEKKDGDEHLPVVQEALDMASKIAGFGQLATQAAKEAVNAALDLPLSEGLRLERRIFHSLFATNDQKEGMSAFAEKRKPTFTNS
ncbi:probable enoyl-CoA hydratase precursor, mitochondrial [Serendipita indica DSM 11827]|uniref:Probable enoyl-CoA hydratase, mitochondrial n=1 Tax=Serendipita indica (strain DSM 11827) TaxID=1109443 RepID=G4TT48_SERID|nr:probable enoyl-CoA hydratase precursor, mitochondrial [Serendipita indica DSM 11827]